MPSTSQQNTHKFQIVCLPIELIKQVREVGMSNIKINKSLLFVDLLLNNVITNKKQVTEYIPTGSKYLRKVFNSRYSEWLNVLLEHNIIQCNGKWIKFLGISLGYRVNAKLVTNWDDIEVLKIKSKSGYSPTAEDSIYLKGVNDFLNSLEIDFKKHHSITVNHLKGTDDETSFKRFSWIRAIRLLENGFLLAKRSSTNNRLNTNFTILPNPLFDEIKKSNNLLEIDAVNSQFAILANMIKDKVNDDFIDDAIIGDLYEKVAVKLNCDRNEAKIAMLKTVYSKAIYENKQKELIRELYPETIALLDEYKTKKSNRELAIRMQKKEAEIYIDGVLNELYTIGITAISKHDSIIFHNKDREGVEKVVLDVINRHNFELKLKIS